MQVYHFWMSIQAKSGSLRFRMDTEDHLTVYGEGKMPDYTDTNRPIWDNLRHRIRKVTIAEGVRNVGARAFENCSLETLELAESVSRVGAEAFLNCGKLKEVRLSKPWFHWQEERLGMAGDGVILGHRAFFGTPWQEENLDPLLIRDSRVLAWFGREERVVIPEGVTEIASLAFAECPIMEVKLPKSLKRIGCCAFQRTKLQEVVLPKGLELVDAWAFHEVKTLTTVQLANRKTEVDPNAFEGTGAAEQVWELESLYRLGMREEQGMGEFRRLQVERDPGQILGVRNLNLQKELYRLLENGWAVIRLTPNGIGQGLSDLDIWMRDEYYRLGQLKLMLCPDDPEAYDFCRPENEKRPVDAVLGLRPIRRRDLPLWYAIPARAGSFHKVAEEFLRHKFYMTRGVTETGTL